MARSWAFVLAASLAIAACSETGSSTTESSTPIAFDRVSSGEIEHGQRIAAVLGCTGCHGKDLTGRDWSDELGVLWTANLTRSAEKFSDEEFHALMTTGQKPTRPLYGMPSHLFTKLSDSDARALMGFVRSLPVKGEVHPEPTISPQLQKMIDDGSLSTSAQDVVKYGQVWPPDGGKELALGRYIARATCAECHGMDLRGGEPAIEGDKARPDLHIVAAYEPVDFAKLMRSGTAAGGRELGLMKEVALGRFANMTEREVEALRAYLVQVAQTNP